jgi:hypothetical protein
MSDTTPEEVPPGGVFICNWSYSESRGEMTSPLLVRLKR